MKDTECDDKLQQTKGTLQQHYNKIIRVLTCLISQASSYFEQQVFKAPLVKDPIVPSVNSHVKKPRK